MESRESGAETHLGDEDLRSVASASTLEEGKDQDTGGVRKVKKKAGVKKLGPRRAAKNRRGKEAIGKIKAVSSQEIPPDPGDPRRDPLSPSGAFGGTPKREDPPASRIHLPQKPPNLPPPDPSNDPLSNSFDAGSGTVSSPGSTDPTTHPNIGNEDNLPHDGKALAKSV